MNSNNKVVKLLSELIQFQSVTPDTSDCQKYIHNYLSESNFKTEYKKYDSVKNMISTYGEGAPCLAFIGKAHCTLNTALFGRYTPSDMSSVF